jgi:hypothetical protein
MPTHNRQHSSTWETMYEKPAEMVQEYPISTTLVAFGIGLGVGLLIGQSLTESFGSRSHASSSKMEAFGRQMCDALRTSLPEAISQYLPR